MTWIVGLSGSGIATDAGARASRASTIREAVPPRSWAFSVKRATPDGGVPRNAHTTLWRSPHWRTPSTSVACVAGLFVPDAARA